MTLAPIIDRLRAELPGLLAVYLFGSHASGDAGAESDLDLAVLVDGRIEALRLWDLSNAVADLAGCPVDLVDLRAASTVLQYRIVTTGRRVWAADSRAELYESFILGEKTALDAARGPLLAEILREGRVHGR